MALPGSAAQSSGRRLGLLLLSGGMLAAVILFAAACQGEEGARNPGATGDDVTPNASTGEGDALASTVVRIYSSPTCGCCHEYEKYLKEEGAEIESVMMDDLTEMKDDLGIPSDMRSCHTSMVKEYFVEGHVPVEAIQKLLEEQPPIAGIALPGMPAGSPGMGGDKTEPFVIYSIAEGAVEEFMRL